MNSLIGHRFLLPCPATSISKAEPFVYIPFCSSGGRACSSSSNIARRFFGGESSEPAQSPAQILKLQRKNSWELERITFTQRRTEGKSRARLRANQEVFCLGRLHGKSFHMTHYGPYPFFSELLSRKCSAGISEVINTLGSWVQITASIPGFRCCLLEHLFI